MKVPWLVSGVVVGALFIRMPAHKLDVAWELLRCCGGGLLVGLMLDFIFSRWERAARAEDRKEQDWPELRANARNHDADSESS